jgi:uncharacterized protein YwqG
LAFLLQVNLAEVASFDVENQLPASGMLYFYYLDANTRFELYPHGGEIIRVLYTPADRGTFRRADPPDNLPPNEVYRGFALSPRVEWTVALPGDFEEGLEKTDNFDAALDYYDELRDEVARAQGFDPWYEPKHRLLGYPDPIQSWDCTLGTTKLLLQVASDCPHPDKDYPRTGMMWGDVGRIYNYIESNELAARNFDAVWATFENN